METTMKRQPRSACRPSRRKGAVLVLIAVMMIALMGMVAFCVDLGFISSTKGQLHAAADAAALAGAGAMAQAYDLGDAQSVALEYANANVPESYGTVADNSCITFGTWVSQTKTFVPNDIAPNAIRVVVERTYNRGNAVPLFFGKIFGASQKEISVTAIAVGSVPNILNSDSSVYVTSTKDLSNVVLEFADGTHEKFDGLTGYTGTFSGTLLNLGKEVVGVWIKSGCNSSNDGPGYGEHLVNPQNDTTVHGQPGGGCKPHVTATFESTGVVFTDSGATSPVRLVQ
jgi:Flp pilus assembly protein TadG